MVEDWVTLTREEPVDPKRRILDAHHHFWGADDCHDLGHAYPHEQLLTEMGGHNVVGSVYIECDAAWRKDGPEKLKPVGETASVAAVAKRAETSRAPILAIVAYADLRLGNAVGAWAGAATLTAGVTYQGLPFVGAAIALIAVAVALFSQRLDRHLPATPLACPAQ